MTDRILAGQTAIITGAARGLGVAIAEQFARDGANIVLVDRNGAALPAIAKKLHSGGAGGVAWTEQDLSKEKGGGAAIAAAISKWGRVDILVNNAGGGIIRPFLEHTPETLVETINRNLWTTIWCIRAALPEMLKRDYGRIVNIGADSVHTGIWSHAGYNAAKGGVNALTTGLAFEFAKQGITVNVVSPGGIATEDNLASLDPNHPINKVNKLDIDINVALQRIPIGRLIGLEDVAATVAFLTYPNTRCITGQSYSVNGGQWMI
jgi:2,3-dihydroxy-2,3-dihydro-p-cumate dehydrogenase